MLTRDQVLHIARLARLKLTDAELADMPKELSAILTYIDVLNEVKTDGVAPTAQVTGEGMVTRVDEIVQSDASPDELLGASPLPIVDRQIRVPSAHE